MLFRIGLKPGLSHYGKSTECPRTAAEDDNGTKIAAVWRQLHNEKVHIVCTLHQTLVG